MEGEIHEAHLAKALYIITISDKRARGTHASIDDLENQKRSHKKKLEQFLRRELLGGAERMRRKFEKSERKINKKNIVAMEEIHQKMIISFITKITSSSSDVARLFLEAHQWDIDAAVSDFNQVVAVAAASARRNVPNSRDSRTQSSNPLRVDTCVSISPPPIRLRSPRSPSRARNPFSREAIQRAENFDEQENNLLNAAKESDDVERAPLPSSSRRLNSRGVKEILSDTPQVVRNFVTIWRNGFTLDDHPLSTLDDPDNAIFLEVVESLESPRVLDSPETKQRFLVTLIRRQQEDFPQDSPKPFQGVGRTLAEPPASSDSLTTEPTPSTDPTAPTTSIKVILADGTPIVSRFTTTHHTIRDVRDFIDAATPDASRDYQLLIMGTQLPPKPLTDLDQTIEQAGISNSVVTQKF
uniref:UBX domain-containing protein n=2 Tax=Brassica campestris TaxID=3711 RepID=M4EN53_BRACM